MDDRCHCTDFSRAQVLRAAAGRSAAVAGQGLPAIEPGMPAPAGTGLDRRQFLLRSAGLALSVYGASKIGLFRMEEGVAEAATLGPQRVLVSVFMAGGADGMSVLAPVGDSRYATLRPTLGLAPGSGTTFAEDSTLMWHPSAGALATLHGEGKVTALPAVGYDHPDQSHFTSRHYWEVGGLDPSGRFGWLGRLLDRTGTPDNPLQGLSLDDTLAPSLASATVPVAALAAPEDYSFWASHVGDPIADPMLDSFGRLGALPSGSDAMTQARRAAVNAGLVRGQVAPFVPANGQSAFTSPVPYPTTGGDFPHRLATLSAMLAAGLPIRCVALNAPGGFDTHSDQATSLAANLQATADGLLAFQRDLEARGLADRVLVLLWSEFGRRPRENGSGTDHGAAGAGFVIGTRAAGQMIGGFPGLATLDAQDNLRATADFRALYCALTEQWFEEDAAAIIPSAGSFDRPAVVRS